MNIHDKMLRPCRADGARGREARPLPPPAAGTFAAGDRHPRRDPDRRAALGAAGGERLVPAALPSASRGYWQNLLKVTKSGVLSRHRHPQPVHGFVLKGSWRYLEHDWVASEGGYVYEAPGETHTLVVDEGVEEMITLFQVNGAMIYVDPEGKVQGYEDVFTKIDMCKAHFESVGLGSEFVRQFIR